VESLFELTKQETNDLARALCELRTMLLEADFTIAGFNIGANVGTAAGQTVLHAHVHLIPRRYGDTAEPAGGVRGVIPERKMY
jgi:ATP adenylyltransferase